MADNWEELEELVDEWDEDEAPELSVSGARLSPEQLAELRQETAQLREFHALAKSILKNSKLDQKFRLFSGVFGASDEVLGAVESGVDFEKRIAAIYQKCRTPEQIQFEVDHLQHELEAEIAEGQ